MHSIRPCKDCNISKPIAEFARDGVNYRRRCLLCYNKHTRPSNRLRNRKRYNNPEYRISQRMWGRYWNKSPKGRNYRLEYQRRARQNPVRNFSDRLSHLLRDALNSRGLKKGDTTRILLGYTPEELFEHLRKYVNKPCEWCGTEIYNWRFTSIDHIVPLRTASSEAEVLHLNRLANLRLIHSSCNLEKGGSLLKKPPKVR